MVLEQIQGQESKKPGAGKGNRDVFSPAACHLLYCAAQSRVSAFDGQNVGLHRLATGSLSRTTYAPRIWRKCGTFSKAWASRTSTDTMCPGCPNT